MISVRFFFTLRIFSRAAVLGAAALAVSTVGALARADESAAMSSDLSTTQARDEHQDRSSSRSSDSTPGVLQIKPVVEVDGHHDVRLEDLVEARGVGPEVVAALRDVRLSDAPRAGESRRFSSDELTQALRVHLREIAQVTGEMPIFRIPSRVIVMRKTLSVKSEDVQKAILSRFKSLCADCEFELTRFTMPILPKNLDAGGSWAVQVRPELPKGSFSIALEIKNQTGEAPASVSNTYWVTGQVVIRKQAAVASRAVMAGEKLAPEDFEIKSRDVTFATDTPASAAEISTSVLARATSAGDVIWRSQLRREMALHNGDAVKVVVGSDEWQISTEGVAQGSGYLGDLVRVKIPRTQKIVSGILREKGMVEVQ